MRMHKPLFIGHGSPMNAIADNRYARFLRAYGQSIRKPEAIVVVSAHWRTKGTYITGNEHPEQIYDFWGFPDELYTVRYAPKGAPEIAREIERAGIGVAVDAHRGVDHAGWAVVKHMYPDQDVPLLQISLDVDKDIREHFALGAALSPFSRKGVLFIGSGNMIHNLRVIDFDEDAKPFDWAARADAWVKERLENAEIDALLDYARAMPDFKLSVPTDEHYLPLAYILGMKGPEQGIATIYEEIQNGSVSMRSIEIA